jgi:MFS family permease
VLIAFRALQGASVSAMMVAANAVLADSWEPAQRGRAMGVFAVPTRACSFVCLCVCGDDGGGWTRRALRCAP